MIKNKLTISAVLMSAVLAMACSSSGSGSSASGGGSGGLSAANGTWLRPCIIDDVNINLSDGVYEVTTYVFNGNRLTASVLSFTDENCTTPAVPHELAINATYTLPGGTQSTSLGEAQFINISTNSVTLDGVPPPPVIEFPIIAYDIILISESNLYTGLFETEEDGETPETRTTKLDIDYGFTRQ